VAGRLLTVQEMAGGYGKRARCTGTLVHSGTQTLKSANGECRLPLYLKQRAMKYGWYGGRAGGGEAGTNYQGPAARKEAPGARL
jgi:hypothetical protein